mgnify:FL=1
MKKLNILALAFASMLTFTACESDNGSNPTVQQPSTFQLNTPALAVNVYDLENSGSIKLTCQQPDYGYTAAVTYFTQISLTGTWNEATSAEADDATYIELDGSYTTCEFLADAAQINRAIMKLGSIDSEEEMPADAMTLYVRMRASLQSGYECYSNVIELSVAPYFVPLVAADPQMWYLIGGCIGDGGWGAEIGTGVIPMSLVDGHKYDEQTGEGLLTFTGYFPSDGGFKIVQVPGQWAEQWGGVDNDINQPKKKDDSGEGADFFVPVSGYYTITLDTKADVLKIEKADDKNVYSHLFISGDFNGWGTDTQMTPVNVAACMEGHNHIWMFDLDATGGDTTTKFLYDGWSPNWGAANFPFGIGTNGGANIPVAAGNYRVIFNDIDGYYHFFAK